MITLRVPVDPKTLGHGPLAAPDECLPGGILPHGNEPGTEPYQAEPEADNGERSRVHEALLRRRPLLLEPAGLRGNRSARYPEPQGS